MVVIVVIPVVTVVAMLILVVMAAIAVVMGVIVEGMVVIVPNQRFSLVCPRSNQPTLLAPTPASLIPPHLSPPPWPCGAPPGPPWHQSIIPW